LLQNSMSGGEHGGGSMGLCTLQVAVGEVEACPGVRCPFWETDGGGCALAAIGPELAGRPAVAEHLLELRHDLELAAARAEWPLFYRHLNEEQEAGG
jgi:hypothetical protein